MCKVCEEDKHNSYFHKSTSSKDGLNTTCKECRKVITKIYVDNTLKKLKKLIKSNIIKKEKIEISILQTTKEKEER